MTTKTIPPYLRRPRTRADCIDGPRPCPWVGCRYHLYLSVSPETGAVNLTHPNCEPWELEETCALDIADRGGTTLEEIARYYNRTRERIRQIEEIGLRKIRCSKRRRSYIGDFAHVHLSPEPSGTLVADHP